MFLGNCRPSGHQTREGGAAAFRIRQLQERCRSFDRNRLRYERSFTPTGCGGCVERLRLCVERIQLNPLIGLRCGRAACRYASNGLQASQPDTLVSNACIDTRAGYKHSIQESRYKRADTSTRYKSRRGAAAAAALFLEKGKRKRKERRRERGKGFFNKKFFI